MPGFGGAQVVRVVDDGAPDEWVDVVVGEDGRRELLRWSEAFDDEQVKSRGLAVAMPRDAGDGIHSIVGVASPLRLSATPPVLRHAPPALGQHTFEVLA